MSFNAHGFGGTSGAPGAYTSTTDPINSSTRRDPFQTSFAADPTTTRLGVNDGDRFTGQRQAARKHDETSGVIEARPGIIETSNIDPLNENSNKDDGWANATRQPGGGASASSGLSGLAHGALDKATGVAKYAYGAATGNEERKREGLEAAKGRQ